MTRTKLADRVLPDYTPGEEITNTVTHGLGAVLGVVATVLCVCRAWAAGSGFAVTASAIYGASMIAMFTISSVYHSMKPGMGKKVMQVVDHCTIYFLIAGTYTAIVLSALRQAYPVLAWGLFAFQWILGAVATTLTAIDLKKYEVFSMICYIGMGWAVIPFWRAIFQVLTKPGFLLLLLGGIAYTLGSVLYGIGARRRWMHSVFHVFVVIGAALHFFAVLLYAI